MKKNALLIYETNGEVLHRFCPQHEANAHLSMAKIDGEGAAVFIVEADDAHLVFETSYDFQKEVSEKKAELRQQIRVRAALDKEGIPQDADLRNRIVRAWKSLN